MYVPKDSNDRLVKIVLGSFFSGKLKPSIRKYMIRQNISEYSLFIYLSLANFLFLAAALDHYTSRLTLAVEAFFF